MTLQQAQKCSKCGRIMRFEFTIRNGIWNQINKPWCDRVLCIECFLEELVAANPRQDITPDDFVFMGIVDPDDIEGSDPPRATNPEFGGILIDRTTYRQDPLLDTQAALIDIAMSGRNNSPFKYMRSP